jgi:hypothetical protein
MDTVIDNDILIKGACYGILCDLVSGICPIDAVGILGSSRFVVPKRIERSELKRSRAAALETFSLFVIRATTLEPSDDEQRMAADLELMAQRTGVSLDSGESQLCAIFAIRLLSFLLTGDKRAIAAMETLVDCDARLSHLCGKVLCLEQLFLTLLNRDRSGRSRDVVCAEPNMDKALSNCFGCYSDSASVESQVEGLQSYIADLRGRALRILSL